MNATISGLSNLPDLRNGSGAALRQASRASSLAGKYSYQFINRLPSDRVHEHVFAFVAIEYAKHGRAMFEAAIPNDQRLDAQGDMDSWKTYIKAVKDDSTIRCRAITIGCARAAYAGSWRITSSDINANELDQDSLLTYTENVAAGAASAAASSSAVSASIVPATALPAAGVAGTIGATSNLTENSDTLTLVEAILFSCDAMTDTEQDFGFCIMKMAIASPPAMGVCLFKHGHHYLSNDVKMTRVVEKQVLSVASPEVKAFFNSNVVEIRDSLWHKSGHAIDVMLCKGTAISQNTVTVLNAVGLGSATVRLPYIEDAVTRATAYIAVIDGIQASLPAMKSSVTVPMLRSVIASVAVCSHPHEITGVQFVPPANYGDVVSRDDMITRFLLPAIETAKPTVAFAAGVYNDVTENANIRGDTRLTAQSIIKLMKDYSSAFANGKSHSADHRRFARSVADKGMFVGVAITDDLSAASAGTIDTN